MYRETVDPDSPIITLLTPGWRHQMPISPNRAGSPPPAPPLPFRTARRSGRSKATTTLTAATPVTLVWDNGQGLIFRRTFAVDDYYLFTVTQSVENQGAGEVALFPMPVWSRHGTPKVANFFIQHEGPHRRAGFEQL
jgi:YidC/Oxa1 family membrane protein insertase